jgi:hypothetical protein
MGVSFNFVSFILSISYLVVQNGWVYLSIRDSSVRGSFDSMFDSILRLSVSIGVTFLGGPSTIASHCIRVFRHMPHAH